MKSTASLFAVSAALLVLALPLAVPGAQGMREGDSSSSAGGCSTPCTPQACLSVPCPSADPYLCVAGENANGCSPTPWQSGVCAACCDYMSCFLPCGADCSATACSDYSCSESDPYLCTQGNAAGQCGGADAWSVASGCTACCNVSTCNAPPPPPVPTPTPPPPPPTAAPVPPTAAPPSPPTPAPPSPPTPAPSAPASPAPTPAPPGPTATATPVPSAPPATPQPPSGACPACPLSLCSKNNCNPRVPYLCAAGPAKGGCEAAPWLLKPSVCTACCSILRCPAVQCDTCNATLCADPPCPARNPFVCTSGPSAGGCSPTPWTDPVECSGCCTVLTCGTPVPTDAPSAGPATPAPPNTFPPPLTPQPGWTANPTPFPPVTPIPHVPQRTAIPSSASCPPCHGGYCTNASVECDLTAPFLCLAGQAGCQATPWQASQGCTACCNLQPCLTFPTPYPPSPWKNVPFAHNCNLSHPPKGAPDPAATPFGGIDVARHGCRASVTPQCCGETPRFNWILATCSEDPSKRVSQACNHTFGNTSKMDLYYIHAYQWNSSGKVWVLDPNSSVAAAQYGGIINWSDTNLQVGSGIINGAIQDWDAKYAPTTANSGTNGLGPPGLMFVMSAKQFTWSSLYLLNQLTMNLGPDSDANCWGSSAGELDFLEPAFWAGVELPGDRLFTTITANAGRCFPVQKAVSKRFNAECNDANCCEMCACPSGMACYGNPAHAGYKPMGCIDARESPPPGDGYIVFTVDGSNTSCSDHYGSLAGGANSSAFFAHDTAKDLEEAIFVAVVDADGVTVFRWHAQNETDAGNIWKGIGKFSAAETLPPRANRPIPIGPPCRDWLEPCGIYESSCDDECVILSASGIFGTGQASGEYAAESAKDGLNWWNLFESTGQTPDVTSRQLPLFTNVPLHPVPLPFYCNHTCPKDICENTGCGVTNQFECINGSATGGCSSEYYTWPTSPFCSACCDVKSCVVPCLAQCPPSACDKESCSVAYPEFCMSGVASKGCNNVTSTWSGCSECCDTRSCPQPKGQ